MINVPDGPAENLWPKPRIAAYTLKGECVVYYGDYLQKSQRV
jgi:hypothetical protein